MSAREPPLTGSPAPPPPDLAVSPFRAVRYTTPDRSALARLTSPAYDLVDAVSRTALERADPYNVVRLILPRADARTGDDAYASAARTLADWRAEGVLAPDDAPGLYRYEMADGATVTRGLVATVELRPPAEGVILPHEDTMAGPVADRLQLLEATQANLEPIVLVYDGDDPATNLDPGEPVARLHADDGVEHTVWPIVGGSEIAAIIAALAPRIAVIADGHHRYASYLGHQRRQRAAGAGAGPWDRALVYLVALGSHGLRTQAIHRVLPTLELTDAVPAAARAFHVTPVEVPAAGPASLLAELRAGRFLLTDGRSWHLLHDPAAEAAHAALGTTHSADWRALDVAIAHRLLIRDLWQLADDEQSVRFGYDLDSTLEAVRRGGTALLLAPTPAASVLAVARQGELMPRKSTLFVPKPRTGLLLRCYADER